jgi:acetyltransferase-like isoleucine patch superfamily enzyme
MRFAASFYFRFCMLLTAWLPDFNPVLRMRGVLLRPIFKSCGRNLRVVYNVQITFPGRIDIGDDVFLGHGVWIHGMGGVALGDGVSLAPYTVIVSSAHRQEQGSVGKTGSDLSPVMLERGVYTGAHAVVLMGVTVGENAMITPGSVVSRDVPANAMATGNPARAIMRPVH